MNTKAKAQKKAVNTARSNRTTKPRKDTCNHQVDPNKYQDKLFRDVWCALIKDTFHEYPVADVLFLIKNEKDLGTCISFATDVADYILYGGERPLSPFMRIVDMGSLLDPDHRRKCLQVCRFGKRYTPVTLPQDMQAFWEVNRRVGAYDPSIHTFIIYMMKSVLEEYLKNYKVRPDEWSISTGSDFEGNKTVSAKILSAERYIPSLMGPSLGTPIENIISGALPFEHTNRIVSVPKTYNKVRYIAMEHQWMSVLASPIASAIERCLPTWADIHDQSHNQDLARAGSIDNSLCTVDLSAASDSLSISLMENILPSDVFADICDVTSRFSVVDTKSKKGSTLRKYNMISTMGNRVTFPLETLVFSAAVEVTAALHGTRPTSLSCGVYGDDIICPAEWYDTLETVLTACGFVINDEKSFADDSFFRESCGADYYKGQLISSSYWPRRAITRVDGLPSLVALQHKFYNLPYVNEVICQAIREICPKITESLPGSPYDDLWSYYPRLKETYGSYAEGAKDQILSCEIHTMFESERGDTAWNETIDRYRYYSFLKYGHRPHADPVLAAIGYPADQDRSDGIVHPQIRAKNRKFLK